MTAKFAWIVGAVLAIAFAAAQAAPNCPASVKVGTPDFPMDVGEAINDDPAFARMHLETVNRLLPRAQDSCRQGVPANCRLAEFLVEAQAGLSCHAGVAVAAGGTASQMHSGDARRMGTASGGNGTAATTATTETCRCGPDYVACWVRNSQRSGGRYSLASGDGWDSIVFYDSQGRVAGNKGWKRGTAECSAIVK